MTSQSDFVGWEKGRKIHRKLSLPPHPMIDNDLLPKTSSSSFSTLLDLGDYCTPFHLITCFLEIGLHTGYNKKYLKYVGYPVIWSIPPKSITLIRVFGFGSYRVQGVPLWRKMGVPGLWPPPPPPTHPPLARRSLKFMDRLGSPWNPWNLCSGANRQDQDVPGTPILESINSLRSSAKDPGNPGIQLWRM